MARKPETVFRIRLRQRINKIPNSWFESIQQSAISGTPDILGVIAGRFVAIEVKTDEGVLSKLQAYKLEQIEKAGGVAVVITPSNMEEKLIYLEGLENDKHNTI